MATFIISTAAGLHVWSTPDGAPTPAAPSGLTATAVSASRIDLAWTDNASDETGFVLERAPNAAGSPGTFAQIATPAANATTYSNTSLTASTKYHYRVKATNAAGSSTYSNTANATTSAAADGFTIDDAWLAANGPAPYLLSGSGATYTLEADVTADETAFVAISNGVTLDLNGHTVTYDNGTEPALLNGGFETADGTLGATFAANWDFTDASSLQRVARTQFGFWGDWMLQTTGTSGAESLVSDPITLPVRPCRYMAWVIPRGPSSATVSIGLVEDGNESNILAGGNGQPDSGYAARAIYDAPADAPAVRVKIFINSPGTLSLDFAGLAKCDVWGIVGVGTATGAPIQLLDDPRIGDIVLRSGTNMTVVGPGTITQAGRSSRSHGFCGRSTACTLTGPFTIDTLGLETSGVHGKFGTGTITGLTITQDFVTTLARQEFYAGISFDSPGNDLTITGCHLGGRGHAGIVVTAGSWVSENIQIHDNTIVIYSTGTDGYGIVLNGIANSAITGNTITPPNGRGILLDSFNTNPSHDVTIQANTISVRERANLEFGRDQMEATALRIRSYAIHQNIRVIDNILEAETSAAAGEDQWVWAAIGARIGVRDGATEPYMLIEGNTLRAVVLSVDGTLPEQFPSTAIAINFACQSSTPQVVPSVYTDNTFESNHIAVLAGDNDSFAFTVGPHVLTGNTIVKSSLGDQALAFEAFRIGEWNVVCSDLRVYSTAYTGGASEAVAWGGPGGEALAGQQVTFGDRLTVSVSDGAPVAGAGVAIEDAQEDAVHSGTTDAGGLDADIPLGRRTLTWDGDSESEVDHNPFAVTVTVGGSPASQSVDLAGDDTVPFSV